LVVVQESVDEPPAEIVVGVAVKDVTVGAGDPPEGTSL
jgi:hypothetical protein